MRGFSRRVAFIVLGVVTIGVLVAFGAGAAGAKGDKDRPAERVVMFASDGMRPDLMEKYAQGRRHADLQGADEARRHRRQRHDPGVPAQHRRRLVHDGDRDLSVRARLDEQHLLPRRRHVRQPTSFSGRRAAGRHDRQRGRARGQEGRPDRLGRRRRRRTSTARPSTSRTSSPTAACSSAPPTRSSRPASAFFGVDLPGRRRSRRPTGWTGVPAGDPAAPPKETTWTIPTTVRRARTRTATYNVYFYDSVAGGGVNYDHAIVSPVGKTGAAPSIDLKVGDFLPIKLTGANGLIGARAGQTVGHYVKLISLAPDLEPVQALRHVARACDREVRQRRATRCPPAAPARTGSRSTSPTTCCRGRPPTSLPRRPASSTRTPTSSRAATSSGPTACR